MRFSLAASLEPAPIPRAPPLQRGLKSIKSKRRTNLTGLPMLGIIEVCNITNVQSGVSPYFLAYRAAST